jgi:hypothetical protein
MLLIFDKSVNCTVMVSSRERSLADERKKLPKIGNRNGRSFAVQLVFRGFGSDGHTVTDYSIVH